MTFPTPTKLQLPIEPYEIGGYHFRGRVKRKIFLWATHLGDDVRAIAGTEVKAIGEGEVVWSEVRPGSEKKRNWGGLIVLAHQAQTKSSNDKGKNFYSVYGHMRDLSVEAGDRVVGGQVLGIVAEGLTPENGWWKISHLHFGIYVGPWRDVVLPGYKRIEEFRTKVKWWREPQGFIKEYNKIDN